MIKGLFVGLLSMVSLLPLANAAAPFFPQAERTISIEEGLRLLPTEFKSNYTLMKSSKSLQPSTPLLPRAILFGNTADLIVSFSGHDASNGSPALETAEFNPKLNRIFFREILYKRETPVKHNDLLPGEVEFENEFVRITKPNPMKCMACHAVDRSPIALELSAQLKPEQRMATYIWARYSTWPDAYGQEDDKLSDKPEDNERENLKAFKTSVRTAKVSRYKFLELRGDDSPFPYEIYRPMSRHHDFDHADRYEGRFGYGPRFYPRESSSVVNLGLRPNLRLGLLLSINHSLQAVHHILVPPKYDFGARTIKYFTSRESCYATGYISDGDFKKVIFGPDDLSRLKDLRILSLNREERDPTISWISGGPIMNIGSAGEMSTALASASVIKAANSNAKAKAYLLKAQESFEAVSYSYGISYETRQKLTDNFYLGDVVPNDLCNLLRTLAH